jgi:quercetin dioxygenase-like cupin family protein
MLSFNCPRRSWLVAFVLATLVSLGSAKATDLNPAAIAYKLPDQIKWTDEPIGSKHAVLVGDPDKPGLYVILVKWTAHHMSHPHFHPNDRFITVLSGTWWVGTGNKFDPDSTVALPAGTFVTHFGKQIHYDGAKEGDTVLEIAGEGPATATPAEQK